MSPFYLNGLFCQLCLFFRFFLYLVEMHSEAVDFLLAFIVLAVGVSQVFAEDIPGAAEVGERGVELFKILPDFGGLLFDLQAVQAHRYRHKIRVQKVR